MDFKATKEIIGRLPESKRELATALYEKCVFQNSQMEELQKVIKKHGWTEAYQNGANQSGRKKTGEADSYLSLSKVFNSTVKQLNDIIGSAGNSEQDDELTEFLKGRGRVAKM